MCFYYNINYIIHPLTNNKLPLNSNEAKRLLKQYSLFVNLVVR